MDSAEAEMSRDELNVTNQQANICDDVCDLGELDGTNNQQDDDDHNVQQRYKFSRLPLISRGSRVGASEQHQQQQSVAIVNNQLIVDKSTRHSPESAVEIELKRIEMHEKLLLNNQKRLFKDLSHNNTNNNNKSESSNELNSTDCSNALDYSSLNAAIECRNLCYQTVDLIKGASGAAPFQKTILRGVNLNVPEACIYGLLGPSGCGKTTMLRCVAGRLKPSSGSISVFGCAPNERGSQIPGPAIGYMPQELSVYEEFTIDETLVYFGRINRMKAGRLLQVRVEFLIKFLGLPNKRRLVSSLSGGQKRRVSLAAALVHSPPLLILDEPTVGVDPVLRQTIWNHLLALASADKITIIITTHYIEEARQAHVVGLMRHGKLLAEAPPTHLMQALNLNNLEDVFLKLCVTSFGSQTKASNAIDELEEEEEEDDDCEVDTVEKVPLETEVANIEEGTRQAATSGIVVDPKSKNIIHKPSKVVEMLLLPSGDEKLMHLKLKPMLAGQKYPIQEASLSDWFRVLATLTWKNHLRLRRNPAVIVFEFLLPALQVILFCLCIGGDPFDIPLAVVNDELVPQASKLFLDSLSERATFVQHDYGSNLSAALESVRHGQTWATVHIPRGYTRHLNERLLHPADATNETITNGTIQIYPDLTNLHLALAIEGTFRDSFLRFARKTLDLFGYDTQLAELPIKVGQPIYGSLNTSGGYLEFMAPGVVISITYVMATGLTALAFILERRDGMLERSQVAGASINQILLAHALLQVFVMIFQITLVLVMTFYVFKIPSRGPFIWVILLVLLQGCTGMSFGLLISAVCKDETQAVMMLVGTFYINLILAGIMWPIEAMPHWLRMFSYAQPQTMPTDALRNILSRGWSIGERAVLNGFLVTIGWLLVFLFGASVCMRYIK